MTDPYKLSPTELETLASKAIAAKKGAYCPYSNFRVGAAVLTAPEPPSTSPSTPTPTPTPTSTYYHTGANVEIAATPVGTCAERCALAALVAAYERPALPRIRAVAVSSDVSPPASPCGMCRQFLREFCGDACPVYMFGRGDDWRRYEVRTVGELLPLSFGPGDMERGKGIEKVEGDVAGGGDG